MIDAHIHHQFKGKTKEEEQAELTQLKQLLREHDIKQAVLYMIYDDDFTGKRYALDFGKSIIPACMLNPKAPVKTFKDQLQLLCASGVKVIKLLPYEQRILRADYPQVNDCAKLIDEAGMVLTICGSYGSKDVYNTNGVELAAYILERGFTSPLIVAHGGMVRQLDTYALMREYENLYIDISFTIPFWKGSSIIGDLAFMLKDLSYERCFYGSDHPYISLEDSIQAFNWFCEEYHINDREKEMLLELNFKQFASTYLSD